MEDDLDKINAKLVQLNEILVKFKESLLHLNKVLTDNMMTDKEGQDETQ